MTLNPPRQRPRAVKPPVVKPIPWEWDGDEYATAELPGVHYTLEAFPGSDGVTWHLRVNNPFGPSCPYDASDYFESSMAAMAAARKDWTDVLAKFVNF